MMANCGQDQQADPPPSLSPNQNETTINHDNPPHETVETHRQGEENTDLQEASNDVVLSNGKDDELDITNPIDEETDQEPIKRDFVAGKRKGSTKRTSSKISIGETNKPSKSRRKILVNLNENKKKKFIHNVNKND